MTAAPEQLRQHRSGEGEPFHAQTTALATECVEGCVIGSRFLIRIPRPENLGHQVRIVVSLQFWIPAAPVVV